jgi:hypothetical protein
LKSHETSRLIINCSPRKIVEDGQVNLAINNFSARSLDTKSGDCTLSENKIVMFERDNDPSAVDESFPGSGDKT